VSAQAKRAGGNIKSGAFRVNWVHGEREDLEERNLRKEATPER